MRKLVKCNICRREKEVVFLFMSKDCKSCGAYDCRNCLDDYYCSAKCRKIAEFRDNCTSNQEE